MNIWNYIKEDMVNDYFGITNPIYNNIISVLIIIIYILLICLIIKLHLEITTLRKKRKIRQRKIDKLWLELMKDTSSKEKEIKMSNSQIKHLTKIKPL